MLTRILKHEWLALRSDATLWVIAGVFGVAIGYGVWNGAGWVSFQHRALAEAVREEATRYQTLNRQLVDLTKPGATVASFVDPRSPSVMGQRLGPRYAMLPPGPLAALSVGQSDLLPYYFKISTDSRETIMASNEIENPNRLLAGRFDLAFVLIFLYPLLILALTYNMLSAEQEQGTLALLLSQPVSLRMLVSGKVLLRAAILIGVVVAFSAVALVASRADLTATGVAVRLLLWIGAVAVYGAFWFALAIYVSSLGRNSTANATMLAGAWLVFVVMTPAFFNLTATSLYPVPSRVEMIQAIRVATDEANKGGNQALARYYEDHPELATGDPAQAMNDFNIVRVAVNDDIEVRVRPVVNRYEQQIASQQRTVDRLQFLSPMILMQNALNDVAGTGTARHRDYLAQVDAFHKTWRGYFVPKIFSKTAIASPNGNPRFVYREEPASAVVQRVIAGLIGLLLPALALGWIGLRRLRRFPVAG